MTPTNRLPIRTTVSFCLAGKLCQRARSSSFLNQRHWKFVRVCSQGEFEIGGYFEASASTKWLILQTFKPRRRSRSIIMKSQSLPLILRSCIVPFTCSLPSSSSLFLPLCIFFSYTIFRFSWRRAQRVSAGGPKNKLKLSIIRWCRVVEDGRGVYGNPTRWK